MLSPADCVNASTTGIRRALRLWRGNLSEPCGGSPSCDDPFRGEAGTGELRGDQTHPDDPPRDRWAQATFAANRDELYVAAKELQAPYDLVREVAETGTLPVVLFTAGGVATPADAALMMQLGADGVFVGSGIFKSGDPARRAAAIVKATALYADPAAVAEASTRLGEAMVGINVSDLAAPHRLAERGW